MVKLVSMVATIESKYSPISQPVRSFMLLPTLLLILLYGFQIAAKEHWPEGKTDIEIFEHYASHAVTIEGMYQDKTETHRYQELYGNHLLPFIRNYHNSGKSVKFMEIGMGCSGKTNFHYGAGINIWKALFSPKDELWFTEFNAQCIENAKKAGTLNGVHAMQGNQESRKDLQRWLDESKGNFNVIIDDGGHLTQHIIRSFYYLFDYGLAPGGMYVIEDMQVNGMLPIALNTEDELWGIPGKGHITLMDAVASWTQEIILENLWLSSDAGPIGYKTKAVDLTSNFFDRPRIPLPAGVKSIFCYPEACILMKCDVNDKNKRCEREQARMDKQRQAGKKVKDEMARNRKWYRLQAQKQKRDELLSTPSTEQKPAAAI